MTARTSAVAALAALAAVAAFHPRAAAAPQSSSASSEHLVFAVVRSDGLLLPFAAFDGRKWSTPWPGEIDRSGSPDLPINIASVPPKWWGGEEPGPWRLWPLDGTAAAPVALQSPVMMRVGVSRVLGVRTDRPPVLPPVPPFVLPFPKIGVAIAGEAKLEPISSGRPLTPEGKTFAASLREEIDKAEERSISTLQGNARWRHPFKREARAKIEAELEAWYVTRLADSSTDLSYIEAVKKYPVLPADEGCGLETFVSGWVHHGKEQQKPRTRLKAAITYCDRRGVSYMLPFGQVHLAGRTHWIVQMSGRDHEWYAVIDGRDDQVKYVVEYQAGRLIFIPQ